MTNKLYKLMNWPAIEEIIYSEASNPHALLGPHTVGNNTLFQAFFPGAQRVQIQFVENMTEKDMEMADEDGFLPCLCPAKRRADTVTLLPCLTAMWKFVRMHTGISR